MSSLHWSVAVEIHTSFKMFGNVKIEWPGKDMKHPRYPPKGKGKEPLSYLLPIILLYFLLNQQMQLP